MSCLHLVSVGMDKPDTLRQLNTLLSADDAILLLADGITLASHFQGGDHAIHYWDAQLPNGLDDDDVVALTLQFDKTLSWHD